MHVGKYRANLIVHFWQISLNCNPDSFDINTEVLVNQDVTHSRHFSPRDIWILVAHVWRNLFSSFTDDFECTNDGKHVLIIGAEG
jgi:hypothetical protein